MTWRDTIEIHPAANMFPLMTPAELQELADDIKENGQHEKVKVLSVYPGKGEGCDGQKLWRSAIKQGTARHILVDGRNRLDAMELAGVPIFGDGSTDDVPGPLLPNDVAEVTPYWVHDDDITAYVIGLNIHRRHLTSAQKRDAIAALLKANPEQSDRAVAAIAKVDHTTVGTVREKLESTGGIPQLKERKGKDGKTRTATPKKQEVAKVDPVVKPTVAPEPEPDEDGAPIVGLNDQQIRELYEAAEPDMQRWAGEYFDWDKKRRDAAWLILINHNAFGERDPRGTRDGLNVPWAASEGEADDHDWTDDYVSLKDGARTIASQLIEMDQNKLKRIAAYINDHLKHPERTPYERSVALGMSGVVGPDGKALSKTAALKHLRENPVYCVEAVDADGQRWGNKVRFATECEAKLYADAFAVERDGYASAEVIEVPCEPVICSVKAEGKEVQVAFVDGMCHQFEWRPVA
jgi:ParB-like chromosome segregation protein Spo0J